MSKFRTVEISDPRFETDHLRFVTVYTDNLKGRGDICVYVPPDVPKDAVLPIVILLHGVYGSVWSWAYSAGVHRQLNQLIQQQQLVPMIIAMPSDGLWGEGSAYLPHNRLDFERWIAEDVPDAVIETIKGAHAGSPLFIAGLSMGGFGALMTGAKYGYKFKGIGAQSALTNLRQMSHFTNDDLECYRQPDAWAEDVLETFKIYRDRLPPVYFDCGDSDILLSYNRELHLELEKNNIPHIYKENPGEHAWVYWETYIMDVFRFFKQQL